MRRKQHGHLLALVVLSACFGRVSAAEVPVRPFGVIQAGDAQVTLSRDGCFWLTCPDKTTALKAQLVVLGEVGKGVGNQATCRLLDGYPRKDGKSFVFRGEIDDPASEKTWRFEQRVEPVENAIHFSYQIEPLADGKVAEVSLFIDLPVDRWCGKRLFFWPREESLLPENSGLEEYFVSGVARSVVLDVGGRRQVTFQFAEPTFCCGRDMRALQDARETKLPLYRISPILFRGGNVEGGRKSRLEFTLTPNDRRGYTKTPTDHSSTEPLKISAPRPSATTVPLLKRLEIDLDVAGTYKTPFDPDQIRVDGHFRLPSGREVVVPAFFFQDFDLVRRDSGSWVESKGKPFWKIRFAATEVGKHSVFVTARDRSGEVRSETVQFDDAASNDPGYIHVSRDDPRYFVFDNGKPYFAVGHSVAWYRGYHSADPVDSYDKWFLRLGKAKGNCARVFMWAHCLGFEWGKPGQYRLDSAWEMDYVMKLAEEHGIYVKLCLEAWRSFHGLGSLVPTCLPHPYCSKNGGPCETEKDFFTHPEAKRMFRNRLRYLVARWGYSTHIMAWELWNEINCVHGYRAPSGKPSQNVADWTAEMARYLREIDPWRHMVVNSLGTWVADGDRPAAEHEQMWNIPEMDFAQAHLYWKPANQKREEIGKDMGECVPHVIGTIRHYGKPVVVGVVRRPSESLLSLHFSSGLRRGSAVDDGRFQARHTEHKLAATPGARTSRKESGPALDTESTTHLVERGREATDR